MSILCWDKPPRVKSVKEWKSLGFDGGPPGAYRPNMSREDEMKWKAKLSGHTKGRPQVEIRRNGMVLVVSLGGGYKYKYYGSKGVNVHLASSGPQLFTFDEIEQMHEAIQEARELLTNLEGEYSK